MNEWSLRFERNAIRFPSGDQRGVSLSPANSSSCSAFFLPSIGAIQRCFFADQTTFFPSGETCRSSQPSSLQPTSPSKRGCTTTYIYRPRLLLRHLCLACRICRRAFLVRLAAARVNDRFPIRRQPHARDRLAIIAFVMRDLSWDEIRRALRPRYCARLYYRTPKQRAAHGTRSLGRTEMAHSAPAQ